jgi:hypothetical protein
MPELFDFGGAGHNTLINLGVGTPLGHTPAPFPCGRLALGGTGFLLPQSLPRRCSSSQSADFDGKQFIIPGLHRRRPHTTFADINALPVAVAMPLPRKGSRMHNASTQRKQHNIDQHCSMECERLFLHNGGFCLALHAQLLALRRQQPGSSRPMTRVLAHVPPRGLACRQPCRLCAHHNEGPPMTAAPLVGSRFRARPSASPPPRAARCSLL